MVSFVFQTEFPFDFRQSRIGHNASTRQTEFASNTKCTAARQCGLISWIAHSLRHPILHSRWHWVARLSASWNNTFATHSIRIRSIMLARVSRLRFASIFNALIFSRICFRFVFAQTSQWRTHFGRTQSQQFIQQQFTRRFIIEYIDTRAQSSQFAVTT